MTEKVSFPSAPAAVILLTGFLDDRYELSALVKLIAQIVLFHEGKIFQILNGTDIAGLDALFIHTAAVQGHIFIFMANGFNEALTLQRHKLIAADTFHCRIVDQMFTFFHCVCLSVLCFNLNLCLVFHGNKFHLIGTVIPQAFKAILPSLGNEFIMVIKDTSLASTFFIGDIMTQYLLVKGTTYLPIEPLVIVAVIYFVMTFILSKLFGFAERKMSRGDKR